MQYGDRCIYINQKQAEILAMSNFESSWFLKQRRDYVLEKYIAEIAEIYCRKVQKYV